MFQSLSDIRVPLLDIDNPGFIHAATINFLGNVGLFVYRSIGVKDHHPLYTPVMNLLNRSRVELLLRDVIWDNRLIWCHGEWSTYLLHRVTSVADDIIDPQAVEDLKRLGGQIQAEIRSFCPQNV